MNRYPHYWWPLKGARFPSRIAVLDCDGAPRRLAGASAAQEEELTAWHVSSIECRAGVPIREVTARGDSTRGLWSTISSFLSSREQTWLFCGPTGRILPMIRFWEKMDNEEIILSGKDWREEEERIRSGEDLRGGCCVIEEPPTVISCQLPPLPGKLLVLDIRNYGIEITPRKGDCREQAEYWAAGLRDVLSALRSHGRVSLRCTAASQAVSSLRSEDACVRLHCHTHKDALRIERAAYFGGRCEAYRLGEMDGPVWHLDVRNMYPAIGLELPVPVSLRRYHDDAQSARAAGEHRPANCCAHVRLETDQPIYPLRRGGDVVYPVGRFDACLCGAELARAVERCHATRWYSCAEYTCTPALSGYYSRWLALLGDARSRGAVFEAQWIKRVMNALIGKFAEPGRRWVPVPAITEQGPNRRFRHYGPDGGVYWHRNVGWHTQREETSGESYWSVPAIAAWITAAGRCRLWDYHTAAGRQNVWYTDTDSILTNRDGFDRLLRGGFVRTGEVGHLRLVESHSQCTIYGIRHYQLGNSITCAGVPRGDIRPGENRGEYWHRRSAKDQIAVGRSPAGTERVMSYPRPDNYRHGRVMADGTVLPLEIYDE